MNRLRAISLSFLAVLAQAVSAQSWQPLKHLPTFPARTTFLLTDGTVLCQDSESNDVWRLIPDSSGSYVNGMWKKAANLPTGYGPLYYASAVLADGRVVMLGGEYNLGSQDETSLGAIYDPVADSWASLSAPSGWTHVGDAPCALLPSGQLLIADRTSVGTMAILDPTTLTWTIVTSTGKADKFSEEGFTLLPDGTVFVTDVKGAPGAERYIPAQQNWISAGATPQSMTQNSEMGPQVLRPDGTVIVFGANGHNAVYTPPATLSGTGSWAAAPDFPKDSSNVQLDVADGAACLMPNGHVLVGTSPGVYLKGVQFFEFDGTKLVASPNIPNSTKKSSYFCTMLMLPTGQVLLTSASTDVEIFTPVGKPNSSWAPTITNCSSSIVPGESFLISGTQFNGLSQCSAYGDDCTNATNYPLIRVTNLASGHVIYCRESSPSTMAVATGSTPVSTTFSVPANTELGASKVEVVANGIASTGFSVTVNPAVTAVTLNPTTIAGGLSETGTVSLSQKAPSGGLSISLKSSSAAAKVPSSVTVPSGQKSAPFGITTVGVDSPTSAAISAVLGNMTVEANLSIIPPTVASITFTPASVTGGTTSASIIRLNGLAGPSGSPVIVSGGDSSINYAKKVTINAGLSAASFPVQTTAVSAADVETLTATLGSSSQHATLTVEPPSVVSLTFTPNSLPGGQTSAGIVRLNGPAGASGSPVITSGGDSKINYAKKVTIGSGLTAASFPVWTSAVTTADVETITATLGTSSQTATLTLEPPSLALLIDEPQGTLFQSTRLYAGLLDFEVYAILRKREALVQSKM